MSNVHVEASSVIAAPVAVIYAILSDYRSEHSNVLPQQYFSNLQVERGGVGAGTVFRITVRVMGIEQNYHMTVSEPEPGRVLTETDMDTGLATTFTLTPVEGDQQTRVHIATDWNARPGLAGLVEKLTTPLVMRRIYRQQLRQLADYAQRKLAATLPPKPDMVHNKGVDTAPFVERILETENLTGDLEDEPANLLLRWGTSHVRSLVQPLEDEEQAGEKVNALMAVMRKVNRIAGNASSNTVEDTVADLKKLTQLYASAFGVTRKASKAELQKVATTLAQSAPREALTFLLDWLVPNQQSEGAPEA